MLAAAAACLQANRALALYQLGDDNRAIKEMRCAGGRGLRGRFGAQLAAAGVMRPPQHARCAVARQAAGQPTELWRPSI